MNKILVFTFLISEAAMACFSLPRTIKIDNSPYSFSEFKIHGSYLQLMTGDGQEVKFSCRGRKGTLAQEWIVNTTDDPKTKEVDPFVDMVIPNNTEFWDSSETPPSTLFGKFQSGDSAIASMEISSTKSPNKMKIFCQSRDDKDLMQVEFVDASGTAVSWIGASQRNGVRGIAGNDSDVRVDMTNLTEQSVHIPGCGGDASGKRLSTQGSGVTQ